MARLMMERDDIFGRRHFSRIWVEATVTKADIAKGTNSRLPGRHRVTGFWYGTRADSIESYGKIRPVERAFPVGRVGRLAPAYMARKLGAGPRFPMKGERKITRVEDILDFGRHNVEASST